jgi:hypothetical protein
VQAWESSECHILLFTDSSQSAGMFKIDFEFLCDVFAAFALAGYNNGRAKAV